MKEFNKKNIFNKVYNNCQYFLEMIFDQPTEYDDDDDVKRWTKNGVYHRDGDKPAIVESNGAKYFYKNGKRHRDNDRPAIENPDFGLSWWFNGKRHRDNDKPAYISLNGEKRWYLNGCFHRDNNQPAIIDPEGHYVEWWNNGLFVARVHTNFLKINKNDTVDIVLKNEIKTLSELNNPSEINRHGDLIWRNNGGQGDIHSYNKSPSLIKLNGTKKWYICGKLNSINDEPSIIRPDGTKEWYKDDLRHRDNDRPAVEQPNFGLAWWFNGKKHRDDGKPAIVRPDGTKEWYKDGKKVSSCKTNFKKVCEVQKIEIKKPFKKTTEMTVEEIKRIFNIKVVSSNIKL